MKFNEIDFKFSWFPGSMALFQHELIEKCSELYSSHYGKWSPQSSIAPGKNIKLSPERIKEWLRIPNSNIYLAYLDNKLIGYCIASTGKHKGKGSIAWVTQLVVHEEYRNKKVAQRLLFSIWGMSDYFAWGILTSSPYAVRALEKATRRRCVPDRIYRNHRLLINFGLKNVSYLKKKPEIIINKKNSQINTGFFVDHSDVNTMLENVTSDEKPWLLGPLNEGWEWFAFTFQDQEQIKLSTGEIEKMLQASDQITKYAYSRMILDSNHSWTKYTQEEIDFIIREFHMDSDKMILDLGCGNGRHCIELAKRGFKVTGVDYNKNLFSRSKKYEKKYQVRFINDDCRELSLTSRFDLVLCLYDVIGTYTDTKDNISILKTIYKHLKNGGEALISVMNLHLTLHQAVHKFSLNENPNKLLEIPASRIMESTGNIFDPKYYLVDVETNIIYRKEQFKLGRDLPTELIVRDRRFYKDEIESLCQSIGFDIVWSKYVCAGDWYSSLSPTDNKAKEILLRLKKGDTL